ncbi:MAG: 3'-5' exonuclease [Pontiella sp.]|nr:3'-5' exonuclease [Pontiella sp.]
MAISNAEITVLDYESTGSLNGYPNEPWQIGVVSLKQGKIDSESLFESLLRVDPERPFNPHAPGRHAMLRSEIAAAPTPHELWPHIMPRLTRSPLCAHNVATEKKFIRAMAPMHTFGLWMDTLRIARRAWPGCASYALEDLIVLLDLQPRVEQLCPGRVSHDALYDAVASAALLEHLVGQPEWGRVTVGELAGL